MSDLERIEGLRLAFVAERDLLARWREDVVNPGVGTPLSENEPLFGDFRDIWGRYLEQLINSNMAVITQCDQLINAVNTAPAGDQAAIAKAGLTEIKNTFDSDKAGVGPVAVATTKASADNDGGTDPYFVSLDQQMSIETDAFDKIITYLNG